MLKHMKKNLKFILVVISLLIISGGAAFYINKQGEMPSKQLGQRVISYINEKVLKGRATASLVSIIEENKVYKLKVKIKEGEYEFYASLDGKFFFPEAVDLEKEAREKYTIGDFLVTEDEICEENKKPIIYFFGSESCPHCKWERPVIEDVVSKFGGDVIFHNNMNADRDMDVFSKYSTGGVPALVLGCKYYRVGSGEQAGAEQESKVLTALICDLTNNNPTDACDKVQDMIGQLK